MKNKILIGCLVVMMLMAGVMPMVDAGVNNPIMLPDLAPKNAGVPALPAADAPSLGNLLMLNLPTLTTGAMQQVKLPDGAWTVTNLGGLQTIISHTKVDSDVSYMSIIPSVGQVSMLMTPISTLAFVHTPGTAIPVAAKSVSFTNLIPVNDYNALEVPAGSTKTITPVLSPNTDFISSSVFGSKLAILDFKNIITLGTVPDATSTFTSAFDGKFASASVLSDLLGGLSTDSNMLGMLSASDLTALSYVSKAGTASAILDPTNNKLAITNVDGLGGKLAFCNIDDLTTMDNNKITALADTTSLKDINMYFVGSGALTKVAFSPQRTDIADIMSQFAALDKIYAADYKFADFTALDAAKQASATSSFSNLAANKRMTYVDRPNVDMDALSKASAYKMNPALSLNSLTPTRNIAYFTNIGNAAQGVKLPSDALTNMRFSAPSLPSTSMPDLARSLSGAAGGVAGLFAVMPDTDFSDAFFVLNSLNSVGEATGTVMPILMSGGSLSQLSAILQKSCTLQIRCVDVRTGAPIPGALVRFEGKSSTYGAATQLPGVSLPIAKSSQTATTNSLGYCTFSCLPFSSYSISATKDNYDPGSAHGSTGEPGSQGGAQVDMQSQAGNLIVDQIFAFWYVFVLAIAGILLAVVIFMYYRKKKKGGA